MPVYNSSPAYFRASLDSLLAQSWGDFELILSDNASNDEARELYEAAALSDKRIRYVRHEKNMGAVRNFEYVARAARGELFAWVADDDLRAPNFIECAVERLRVEEDLVGVQFETRLIDLQGRSLGPAHIETHTCAMRSAFSRLGALHAQYYNFLIYGVHRTQVVQSLDMGISSIFWDTLQTIDLLLKGPIGTVEGSLFEYRIDQRKDADTYRENQQLGDSASARIQHKYSEAAFLCIARVLSSTAPLSPMERSACAAKILYWAVRRGWLTQDEFYRTIPRLQSAWKQRDLPRTVLLGAKCVALSPTYPFRRWQARSAIATQS